MENQHQKITGYRDLSQAEIDLMNETKALGAKVGELVEKLAKTDVSVGLDQRAIALGRTHLQTGFMWLNRSIARPESFA